MYISKVAIRCIHMEDWTGACVHLTKSFEAHEMVFGDKDQRTIEVNRMLLVS